MDEEPEVNESENEEQESTGDPELDRQVENLEGEGDRVGQEIDDAKRDWEGKQEDPGVPGAVPAEDEEEDDE